MRLPFDEAIAHIQAKGYHNHRREDHSNVVSLGVFRDLTQNCEAFREDVESKHVRRWLNVSTPGARGRKIDLLVGQSRPGTERPHPYPLRLCLENKSVVTPHRNRDARFDDLNQSLNVLHASRPEAVLIATILVGIAERVLNVPDRIKPLAVDFDRMVRPRLSTGDSGLW